MGIFQMKINQYIFITLLIYLDIYGDNNAINFNVFSYFTY